MLIRVRRTRTHAAADWTSANPWLEPLEMGIETESPNKAKINFSDVRVRWNTLDYWNPSGETGGGATILSAVLTADFPKTNDTFANVTDLTLNLEAGRWYEITGSFLSSGVESDGGGVKWDLAGGTCTATGVNLSGFRFDTYDGTFGTVYLTSLAGVIGQEALADNYIAKFSVVIQVDAGGTLIPRFAQFVTDATANSALKYSTIQAVDITPE